MQQSPCPVAPLLPHPTADPGLASVIDAWPKLPEPVRAGILAMVRASVGSDG